MRIVGGVAKGRKLFAPGKRFKHPLVRPTSDRAREAIFNIISSFIADARVLDLFAGTGALGLEALSRGAQSAVFVENHQGPLDLIKRNIDISGFSDKSLVVRQDLAKGLFFLDRVAPASGFSLVFLDPPYGKDLAESILKDLAKSRFLSDDVVIVAEESVKLELPEKIGKLCLFDRRSYGEAGFWLYHIKETTRE